MCAKVRKCGRELDPTRTRLQAVQEVARGSRLERTAAAVRSARCPRPDTHSRRSARTVTTGCELSRDMQQDEWPGNICELENVIERA